MRIGVYLAVTCMVLCACGWFDELLSSLRLNKSYALMSLLSALLLNSFLLTPLSEFELNPAVLLLVFVMLIASLQLGEYSVLGSLAFKAVAAILAIGFLFLMPNVPLYIVMLPISLFTSLFFIKKPIFAASFCSSVPFIVYVASLIIEILFFIPYPSPAMADIFDAQIASLAFSLITSHAARSFILHKKRKEVSQ